jgi:O-antigen/teichoic acid export membrane protein
MLNRLSAGYASVLCNAGLLLGSHAISALIRVIYVVVIARALGPAAYGDFNFGMAWYLLFIAATYLGLDVFLAQRIGKESTQASDVLYQTLHVRFFAALIAASASVVCFMFVESEPQPRKLVAIFSLALVGRALWLWAVSAMTALERTQYALFYEAIFRPMEVVCVVAVLLLRPDIKWLAAVHAVLWWIQGIAGVYTVHTRLARVHGRPTLAGSASLVATTYPAGLYTIVISIFMQAPIVLMKQATDDADYAGQFALAYQACVYLLVLPFVAATALLPVAARSARREDGKDLLLLGLSMRIVSVFGTAVVILAGPAVPWIVESIFGARYASSGALLKLAIWLTVPFTLVNIAPQIFFAREHYRPVGWLGLGGALVMYVLFTPAVTRWSGAGAIPAIAAGLGVWYVGLLASTVRLVPSFDRGKVLRAFTCTCVAATAWLASRNLGDGASVTIALASLVLSCVVMRVFGRSDLATLRDVVKAA